MYSSKSKNDVNCGMVRRVQNKCINIIIAIIAHRKNSSVEAIFSSFTYYYCHIDIILNIMYILYIQRISSKTGAYNEKVIIK